MILFGYLMLVLFVSCAMSHMIMAHGWYKKSLIREYSYIGGKNIHKMWSNIIGIAINTGMATYTYFNLPLW